MIPTLITQKVMTMINTLNYAHQSNLNVKIYFGWEEVENKKKNEKLGLGQNEKKKSQIMTFQDKQK